MYKGQEPTVRVADPPADDDVVEVVMTERIAREFERIVLSLTDGERRLSPPMLLGDSVIPTYIIEVWE